MVTWGLCSHGSATSSCEWFSACEVGIICRTPEGTAPSGDPAISRRRRSGLQGLEESQQRVGRAVAAGRGVPWCGPVEGPFFSAQGRRGHKLGSSPRSRARAKARHRRVYAAFQELHRTGMAQCMCRHFLSSRVGHDRLAAAGRSATRRSRASQLIGVPRRVGNSEAAGEPAISASHVLSTPVVPAVSGVTRCFRPLPSS